MIACVHELSADEQTGGVCGSFFVVITYKACETMTHTSEPFPSSEDASLSSLGAFHFLPVSLSFDEGFCAKVDLIVLFQSQLDSQNEVEISIFETCHTNNERFFQQGTLFINSANISSSFCVLRTLIESKKKVISKMLVFHYLTLHFDKPNINRN